MEDINKTKCSASELLAAVKGGSKFAFERLYSLHRAAVYRHIKRLIKDEDLAMEILQDVFLKVWEKRAYLDTEKCIRAYLMRIGQNMTMDFYRKAKREQQLLDNLQQFATEVADQPMESKISDDEEELLRHAIAQLSPQRQKIFVLCKLEGKSYEYVSQLLGISCSTISDHIVKATKFIRTRLHEQAKVMLILFVPYFVESVHDMLRKII